MSDWFPLRYRTPVEWGRQALADVKSLLSDHAYLESKAATNALALLNHWPALYARKSEKADLTKDAVPSYSKQWVSSLATVIKDEALHLARVTHLLHKKGGRLARLHKSQYANDLRKLVRNGLTPEETVDRLLVSALIEARSCERFEILSVCAKDPDLKRLYSSLQASERGHHQIFLKLAGELASKNDLKKRWSEMLAAEADIIQSQSPGSHLHSGFTGKL